MATTRFSPLKTARAGVDSTYTNLTQPTGIGGGLGWYALYTMPHAPWWDSIGAFCVCRAGLQSVCPSDIGGTMLTTTQPQILTSTNVVEALARFRREWEQAAEGESLVDIQGSVGLMLADLVIALALRPSVQVQVLGSELYEELQSILAVIPENGKGS
jgi:hypothetical protein